MIYTADDLIRIRKEKWKELGDINFDQRLRNSFTLKLKEHRGIIEEIKLRPEKMVEMFFVISNKDKKTVPFFLNDAQKDLARRIYEAKLDYEEGKRNRIRILILKGRQLGFTSFVTAYQLAATVSHRNFEGFTLADEGSNAEAIFETKAKFPYNQLPNFCKPTEKFNNKREFRFSKLNSSWAVGVATPQVGRSRTINFFHGSECAFWKAPASEIEAALFPAMTPDCVSIFESTPNGFNDFKTMWDSGQYINLFYEWWLAPEYAYSFESEWAEDEFMDLMKNGSEWIAERLRWLRRTKGLSIAQCYWYYQTYQGMTDKEKIKQEYPCSPEEAFLMSGRPVFDLGKIVQRIDELRALFRKKPYKEGYFSFQWNDPELKDKILTDSIEFVESKEKNWVRIYEDVKDKMPYVLGGDTKGEGSDYYAATLVDNFTGKRVATLHLNVNESSPYTHQVYCTGMKYNKALVGIEINFNTAPIEELQRLGYPNQYSRRKYDDYMKTIEKKYGWKTDGNTRPLIIDKEAHLVNEDIELLTDIPTLEEMLTFVYDKNGRPDAMEGKHDDLLMSEMIANEMRNYQSHEPARAEVKKSRYTSDMMEDYRRGSEKERAEMEKLWGKPY